MRIAAVRSLLLLAICSGCFAYQPPAAGAPVVGRSWQATSPAGVHLLVAQPDSGGRSLVCPARRVVGEVARTAGDTVEFSRITSWQADAQAPWACRNPRAGLVVAQGGETLQLRNLQFSVGRSLTTALVLGVIFTLVFDFNDHTVIAF